MKTIKLTQNLTAIVDDDDYEKLNKYKWFTSNIYRYPRAARKEKERNIYMAREIMNFPVGKEVDHINRDTLDNRKCNLRAVSKSENLHNAKKHKDNKSGHIGVFYRKDRKKWMAQIMINRKLHYLGMFKTLKDASASYENYKLILLPNL